MKEVQPLQKFWYITSNKLVSIEGFEKIETTCGRKKKMIQVPQDTATVMKTCWYTGKYYNSYAEAINALLVKLVKQRGRDREVVRKAQAKLDETKRLIDHWVQEKEKQ